MIFRRLGLLNKSQKGFTVLELLIVFTVTGLVAGGITTAVFQIFDGSARSGNHMTAIRQVQNAGYWVSRDTQMAQSVDTDNVTPPEILELTWTEWDGTGHEVVYRLVSNQLQRGYVSYTADGTVTDNETSVVAQYINSSPTLTSCNFTDGKLIFTVTATLGSGSRVQSEETRVYEVIPRPSQ